MGAPPVGGTILPPTTVTVNFAENRIFWLSVKLKKTALYQNILYFTDMPHTKQ